MAQPTSDTYVWPRGRRRVSNSRAKDPGHSGCAHAGRASGGSKPWMHGKNLSPAKRRRTHVGGTVCQPGCRDSRPAREAGGGEVVAPGLRGEQHCEKSGALSDPSCKQHAARQTSESRAGAIVNALVMHAVNVRVVRLVSRLGAMRPPSCRMASGPSPPSVLWAFHHAEWRAVVVEQALRRFLERAVRLPHG